MNIFVFSDNPILLAEMLGCAKALAAGSSGIPAAIVIGSKAEAASAFTMGAEKVYWLGELNDHLIDDFIPTITKLVHEQKPATLLVGATTRGKSIAGRVAAALDTTAIVNAKEIEFVDGALQVSHVILGGGAVRIEKARGDVSIATVGAGLCSPIEDDPSRSGQVEEIDFVEPSTKIIKLASKPKKSGASNITTAKRVVGVGRGFAAKEDLQIARDLADALGGEVGYTRPLTEGAPPFAEGEPYIGVSGIQIKPDLYIAAGISGQTQHVIGVNESRVTVCINNEPKAIMFRCSDYGIVGDLYEVLPALTQAIKEARK